MSFSFVIFISWVTVTLRFPFFLDVAPRQWMIAVRRFETAEWSLIPGATYLFVLFLLEENSNNFSPRNVGHKSHTDATPLSRRLTTSSAPYRKPKTPTVNLSSITLFCAMGSILENLWSDFFLWEDSRYVLVVLKVFPSASYRLTTVRYAAMLLSHKVKQ